MDNMEEIIKNSPECQKKPEGICPSCERLSKQKEMYCWCGFHRVPMSRCDKTESGNCYLMLLDKAESERLIREQKGYNIRLEELRKGYFEMYDE